MPLMYLAELSDEEHSRTSTNIYHPVRQRIPPIQKKNITHATACCNA